jgi:hypothetical protein
MNLILFRSEDHSRYAVEFVFRSPHRARFRGDHLDLVSLFPELTVEKVEKITEFREVIMGDESVLIKKEIVRFIAEA